MSSVIDVGSLPLLSSGGPGSVLTVGTFDGVHRGHQAILQEVKRQALERGRESVVVTFHPHPLKVVKPEAAPKQLTTLEEKQVILDGAGVDRVVVLHFTPELREYPARQFVEQILIARLGLKDLVIGHDHGFGKGREGSVEMMRQLGEEHGFEVDLIAPVHLGGEPVSSSRIRSALEAGDIPEANHCLGRPYVISGEVIHGDHRGRELGFPTANLRVDPDKLLPAPGIYVGYVLIDSSLVPSLLHLGPRPTFPGAGPSVETYLLDWSGDLYGRTLKLKLCERIRDVLSFGSIDELVNQMRQDEQVGRALLAQKRGLSGCVPPDVAL